MSRHAEAARKLVKYKAIQAHGLIPAGDVFEDLLDIVQAGTGPIDPALQALLVKYSRQRAQGRSPAAAQVRLDLENYDHCLPPLKLEPIHV